MEEPQEYVGRNFKKVCISFPGGMVVRKDTSVEFADDSFILLVDGTAITAEKIRRIREADGNLFISC